MIINVVQYDPDYFVANTFVLSDFETRDNSQALARVVSLVPTQIRNQTVTNNSTLTETYPNQVWSGFQSRSFDSVDIGQAEQSTYKLAGNYGPALNASVQYPAQDNPVVRVNVSSFDLSETNATNSSTTPVVG
ncbi:hypothetical protein YOLOSWAG_76 [Erwinia phage vB_EamM_Yoloswag]|uniref:Uncharacterized protein n=1 Tax=Erwinia phage vB_EamM_Yoloswag TaxID=1958956 RepID=A0A1S6L323_9CAUD|nr:hypothetical protein HOR66_gp076 [Erwinia phage vB_EamM_Yoloswag]AQT28559.1 hypothetical protein YOLOSWAG_76 [Erwinia phage vB_EamM_Yoloswag]